MKESVIGSTSSNGNSSNGASARAALVNEQADPEQIARLLFEVYGVGTLRDPAYANWQYRQNPLGAAIEINRYDEGRLIAHMAGVPQQYQRQTGPDTQVSPAIIIVNIAIAEKARGRGLMIEMSNNCFANTHDRLGDSIMIGVPNASSTPGYTGRLKFRLVKKLPVYVLPPIWPSFTRVESALASDEYLASSAFRELVASIDFRPGSGWSQRWTGELLTWRMKKPAMRYAVHASKDLVLISARTIQHGVPVCVVVKTFARHGARRSTLGNSVAAAACRFQRAPVGLYAGFSDRVRFTGVPFPERLKPAPLNLIVKPSRPGYFDADAFEYDRFEFFDFDAF